MTAIITATLFSTAMLVEVVSVKLSMSVFSHSVITRWWHGSNWRWLGKSLMRELRVSVGRIAISISCIFHLHSYYTQSSQKTCSLNQHLYAAGSAILCSLLPLKNRPTERMLRVEGKGLAILRHLKSQALLMIRDVVLTIQPAPIYSLIFATVLRSKKSDLIANAYE